MAESDRKLFLGGRLKRLRRELGLTQTRMAGDLGVSPSYLNHLERNQRPVTAGLLLRLASAYDIDLRSMTAEPDAGGAADLAEVLADPLFRDLMVPRHEVRQLVDDSPGVAEAMVRLYRAFTDARGRMTAGLGALEGGAGERASSADWVRDYIQSHRNHFPDLDSAGESLAAELGAPGWAFETEAVRRLGERHGVRVQTIPEEVMTPWLRRFDVHRSRLLLSEALEPQSRAFALAAQLALSELADRLTRLSEDSGAPDVSTRRLLKVALTNYAAAAIRAPYASFYGFAEANGYDVGRLAARFALSWEQAAHRLTTLSRPGARGVPFFLIRVDQAGNVSKRFAAGAFPFSRFGGSCPRWALHSVFRTPGRVTSQIVETPDGERYFTLSRTTARTASTGGGDEQELAIGLGCELKFAPKLVYARGLDLERPLVVEIGPTCAMCERPYCRERAAPPLARTLTVDDFGKSVSPFPFARHD